MSHDYRRGTKESAGPKTLGVVGGLRKDGSGALTGEDRAYAELQLDQEGNARVVLPEAFAGALLDLLQSIDDKLTLILEHQADN